MSPYKTVSDFTTYRAALIFSRANRKLNDFLRAELAEFNLSIPEWGYLGILHDRPGIRVLAAAGILDVEPPFATRLGNELAKKKLVVFSLDPKDGRARLISITPQGATLIQSVEAALRPAMKKYLEPIRRVDLDTFLAVTTQLSELPATTSKPKTQQKA